MFIDSTPKVASLTERFQQLSQLICEIPLHFVLKRGDSPSVWEITNSVCDRHHIEHLC